ncbi:IS256 family transposase, partial [Leptospira stimsonii]
MPIEFVTSKFKKRGEPPAEEEKAHLKVIQVEETLNALLDEEADKLCKASRYER